MSVSQIVRTKPYDKNDFNNPTGIPLDIKSSRIIVDSSPPLGSIGQYNDYYIDSGSGNFYGPKTTTWGIPVYNFVTGPGGGGLTNISNLGLGEDIFLGLTGGGTTANLRTVQGAANQIDVATTSEELRLLINDNYKPVTLSLLNNFPLQVGLGSGTFNPNGVLGSPDYNRGSLFIQVGTTDRIWICNDPATQVWLELAGEDVGVTSIQNTEDFGAQIWRDTVDGVASLKVLRGNLDVKVENFLDDFIDFKIADTYKPITLNNVVNARNGFGSLSAPTGNDDITQGYIKGSIFTEVEIGGTNRLWIAREVSPAGSAQWEEYSPGFASEKQSATFYGLTPVSTNFVDSNFNPLPIGSLSVDFAGGTVWAAVNIGPTVLFRRNATNATGKRYLVNYNITVEDTAGATTVPGFYIFQLVQSPTNTIQNGSVSRISLNPSSGATRGGNCSGACVITSNTAGEDNWFLEVRSSRPGSPGPAPNITLESVNVTFTEV